MTEKDRKATEFCQSGHSFASIQGRQETLKIRVSGREERPSGYSQELDCKPTGVSVGHHCTQSIDT